MASVADGQRSWVIEPEAEERPEASREGSLGKGEDMGPIDPTKKGDFPCFIVQEDSHFTRGVTQGQQSPRGGEGMALVNISFQGPDSISR